MTDKGGQSACSGCRVATIKDKESTSTAQKSLKRGNNIFFNMLQNHSSVKWFTLCIHECVMNIYTKFYPRTVSQSLDMDPSL